MPHLIQVSDKLSGLPVNPYLTKRPASEAAKVSLQFLL